MPRSTAPACADAEAFLACRRLALVGVSRDRRHFSRALLAELRRRGYDVVPVNPSAAGEVDGVPFARSLRDVVPAPEAALLLTPPAVTEEVVKDCAAAGIPRVWMHRGMGPGAASPRAIAFCRDHGLSVVADACPFMFLPGASLVHRAHGWWRGVRPAPQMRAASGG